MAKKMLPGMVHRPTVARLDPTGAAAARWRQRAGRKRLRLCSDVLRYMG